ncbi:hypothetical protein BJV78DRAFT_730142 [Lactifluus subvellereus]|nr:hypothetical protein BJV78DRAFT_730142 [Lactifluus subvellereus]
MTVLLLRFLSVAVPWQQGLRNPHHPPAPPSESVSSQFVVVVASHSVLTPIRNQLGAQRADPIVRHCSTDMDRTRFFPHHHLPMVV